MVAGIRLVAQTHSTMNDIFIASTEAIARAH
jgi:hypothetical protein